MSTEDSTSQGVDVVRDSHRVRCRTLWLVRRSHLATLLVMRSVAVCIVWGTLPLSGVHSHMKCPHKWDKPHIKVEDGFCESLSDVCKEKTHA